MEPVRADRLEQGEPQGVHWVGHQRRGVQVDLRQHGRRVQAAQEATGDQEGDRDDGGRVPAHAQAAPPERAVDDRNHFRLRHEPRHPHRADGSLPHAAPRGVGGPELGAPADGHLARRGQGDGVPARASGASPRPQAWQRAAQAARLARQGCGLRRQPRGGRGGRREHDDEHGRHPRLHGTRGAPAGPVRQGGRRVVVRRAARAHRDAAGAVHEAARDDAAVRADADGGARRHLPHFGDRRAASRLAARGGRAGGAVCLSHPRRAAVVRRDRGASGGPPRRAAAGGLAAEQRETAGLAVQRGLQLGVARPIELGSQAELSALAAHDDRFRHHRTLLRVSPERRLLRERHVLATLPARREAVSG
mmetsp:Transcript_6441/g.14887  ORF Transcript_6441/g.14887 Transcript_6441/m.14887 type:complete len:363 (+) Transcript_6441:481-1569(+)